MTPGRGGQNFGETDVPVFDTVVEAVKETAANVSLIFVPAPLAADAILESAAAGVALVVPIAEGIPPRDMVPVARTLEGSGTRMLGPNCPASSPPASGARWESCPAPSIRRAASASSRAAAR